MCCHKPEFHSPRGLQVAGFAAEVGWSRPKSALGGRMRCLSDFQMRAASRPPRPSGTGRLHRGSLPATNAGPSRALLLRTGQIASPATPQRIRPGTLATRLQSHRITHNHITHTHTQSVKNDSTRQSFRWEKLAAHEPITCRRGISATRAFTDSRSKSRSPSGSSTEVQKNCKPPMSAAPSISTPRLPPSLTTFFSFLAGSSGGFGASLAFSASSFSFLSCAFLMSCGNGWLRG